VRAAESAVEVAATSLERYSVVYLDGRTAVPAHENGMHVQVVSFFFGGELIRREGDPRNTSNLARAAAAYEAAVFLLNEYNIFAGQPAVATSKSMPTAAVPTSLPIAIPVAAVGLLESGSDADLERMVMQVLTSEAKTKSPPLDVLGIRRKAPVSEISPERSQLNRVIYDMEKRGQVKKHPPRGKSSKPTWGLAR